MPVDRLKFGELRIEGVSRAGEETWIRVHPPGLAFDVGRGAVKLAGARDIFISHGHLDHVLGLPFVLSQRSLHASQPTRIFAPAPVVGQLTDLVEAAASLAEEEYEYELEPLEPGELVEVGRGLMVEAFATHHVVPSLGYHLLRRKNRLKKAYRERSGEELAALRAEGIEIETLEDSIWLSYCGDTGPDIFEMEPRILTSPVLVLECTFFAESSRDKAAQYGHMHLDDLVAHAPVLRNRHLVLHHASRRHDCRFLEAEIESRLSLEETRVHLFGCF